MLTIKEISEKFNISKSTLYGWEADRPELFQYLQNASNTGLVYNSLATNAKGEIDLALARQRQTQNLLIIGGALSLAMVGLYIYNNKTEKPKKLKKN